MKSYVPLWASTHRRAWLLLKPLLIISAAVGFAFSQTILAILQTDVNYYPAPGSSIFVRSFAAPFLVYFFPVAVLLALYIFMQRLIAKNISRVFLGALIGSAVGLRILVIFNEQYPSYHLSVTKMVLLLCFTVAVAVGLYRAVSKVFVLVSFMVLFSVFDYVATAFSMMPKKSHSFSKSSEQILFVNPGNEIPRVIHVVFDELPLMILRSDRGEINRRLFPNFFKFSQSSTWYVNATTGRSETSRNLLSFASGRDMFSVGSSHDYFKYLPTIYSALSTQIPTAVWENRGVISSVSPIYKYTESPWFSYAGKLGIIYFSKIIRRKNFSPNIDNIDDAYEQIFLDQTARYRAKLLEFCTSVKDNKFKLNFFYSYLPHQPYFVSSHGDRVIGDLAKWSNRKSPNINIFHPDSQLNNSESADNVRRSFLNQVRYADKVLGEITKCVEDSGQADDTLLVVSSDHGIAYTDAGSGRHQSKSMTDQQRKTHALLNASVVLMVKYPRQKSGFIDERDARPYDIAPTVLDILQAESGWKMDGTSLRASNFPNRPRTFSYRIWSSMMSRKTTIPRPWGHYIGLPKRHVDFPRDVLYQKKVSDFEVVNGGARGSILDIAYEEDIYDDRSRRSYVISASGLVFPDKNKTPQLVLLAVNNRVVKKVRPTLVLANENQKHNLAWKLTIPPESLSVGGNHIDILAQFSGKQKFYRLSGGKTINLSKEIIESLSKSSSLKVSVKALDSKKSL